MAWWKEAVVYQIYPRSFCDSDNDGVGDLNGVRAQLEYLSWLGVDALWISPIFPSPMRDFGYDVTDYVDVDPVFGSLGDFDELVREAHHLGLRVLLDWIPNHTSSDHPWFLDARSSRESQHRDWYVWRDANTDGSLPNNWIRAWSEESVWTWDPTTEQYYLHCFLPSQPDLNWDNDDVRQAMHATLRFWLDRGVDGIRMDVVHLLGKDLTADDPPELRMLSHTPLNDVATTHERLREIRRVLDEYDGERVSVGEVYLFDPERVSTYYGDHDQLHLSFNFASLLTAWSAAAWADVIERSEAALGAVGGWPTWVMSNHDNARVATRLSGDQQRIRAAVAMLLTLRGTPFLYAGEELGLEDAVIPFELMVDPGGRDGCRSPMPWTSDPRHGWPSDPWLPFAAHADRRSVAAQREDPRSMLNWTRRVLALRRAHPALRVGRIEGVHVEHDVLSFDRVNEAERLRVVINFAATASTCSGLPLTSLLSSAREAHEGVLEPGEVAIFEVRSSAQYRPEWRPIAEEATMMDEVPIDDGAATESAQWTFALPERGLSSASLFARMYERKDADAKWQDGRVFSLIYPTGRPDVDGVLLEANIAYLYENALNPMRFPSLGMMQFEVVAMVSSMLHAPSGSGGGFTAGGTESILLSVLVARERARAERGVVKGNIVFARSAHPAFAKAAYFTGLEARSTALADGFVADVESIRDAIDENTVLVVGSAYGFPHGVVDPIEELSDLAMSRGIAFHSDACIGGFVLPFMERLGVHVHAFDFRLAGVTQMSCDVHKYGYATKGASVVVYREAQWMDHQMFAYDQWPAGFYWTGSVAGARAASPIAAAWAVMNYLGMNGYTQLMDELLATTARFRSGILAIRGMEILGRPVGPLLAFTSTTDDIGAIGDVMDDRGWHLGRIESPRGLHMMISPLHATKVDEFLADLVEAAANHGETRGSGARYN